jgi:[CysO sulfur-carrier protein]-S-L-cysteine hydrolase
VSDPFRLVIPRPIFEAMLAHAKAELPAESCGLLAGTIADGVGRVTLHLPLVNALASPTEYESEPRSMLAAHKAMRAAGVDVLAVYHSHPTSEPVPSRRDRERNYGENVVNLIIGLRRAEPEVRGWWLTAEAAREAMLQLDDSAVAATEGPADDLPPARS